MIFKITESMHGVALYGQYNLVVYLCREKPSVSERPNSPRGTYSSNTLVERLYLVDQYRNFYWLLKRIKSSSDIGLNHQV